MSTPGLRIYSDFIRPDRELVEKFRDIPVANISDCMGRLFCMHSSIKPKYGIEGIVRMAEEGEYITRIC